MRVRQATLAIAITTAAFCGDTQSQAPFATLYDFGAPVSPTNLIAGPNGVLYGAADGGAFARGTVFQLTPPTTVGQAWNLAVLCTLTNTDGAVPAAIGLGPGGAIYETTALGGPLNDGTVFELTWGTLFELKSPATPGGIWTETILYAFTGGRDGARPYGGVIPGQDGTLYGTTKAGGASDLGTVFKLTPPATAGTGWTETVLYSFAGGVDGAYLQAGLLLGSNGALYGTTRDGGTAEAGFTGDGTVFELRPPVSPARIWREQILYKFQPGSTAGYYPVAPVAMGAHGAVYGTTCYGGTVYGVVFELQPPGSAGAEWSETVLHTFTGGADSGSPYQGVLVGPGGTIYGTTTGVGTSVDSATIFALRP